MLFYLKVMRPNTVSCNRPFALLCWLVVLAACSNDTTVLTGIDVLSRDDFQPLLAARVAVITNHTGVDRHGQSTIRLLHDAENVELVRIFSPEHSLSGKLDIPIIDDDIDTGTGIPIVSLYGKFRRPTPEMLDGIDTLVFDIQDIGARFYTYISTMGNAMQAAADSNNRFVACSVTECAEIIACCLKVYPGSKASMHLLSFLPLLQMIWYCYPRSYQA